jgi:hypothetical protein
VESRSRDGGSSAADFSVNLNIPIQCEVNQAIGYYLKEAHLPLNTWTVNKGYDSFQIAFPYTNDDTIYTVKLKHGIYTAAEFGSMVQTALNTMTYDATAKSYKKHTHPWPDYELDAILKTAVDLERTNFNSTLLPRLEDLSAATGISALNQYDGLISYVTFKVNYDTIQNRFSISRTGPGRLFKSGQFDIAIEHYQLAKAFGCPWSQKFSTNEVILDTTVDVNNPTYNHPTYYKKPDEYNGLTGEDLRFYVPRSGPSYNGHIYDDSGTWEGNSQSKTFKYRHKYYILSSERWSNVSFFNKGVNIMRPDIIHAALNTSDSTESEYPTLDSSSLI